MNQFKTDNSGAYINYLSHTNSSVAQGIVFSSAKCDNQAAIIKNKTIVIQQNKMESSLVEPCKVSTSSDLSK